MIRPSFVVAFPAFLASSIALAAPVRTGVVLGGNRSEFKFGNVDASGWGGSGGLLVSFLENLPVGMRISLFDHYLRAKGGEGLKVHGHAPAVAATLNVNLGQGVKRVSAGVGYGMEFQSGLRCGGNSACFAFPSTSSGVVLEAKGQGGGGLIGYLQAFFPVGETREKPGVARYLLSLGYEFGQSGK